MAELSGNIQNQILIEEQDAKTKGQKSTLWGYDSANDRAVRIAVADNGDGTYSLKSTAVVQGAAGGTAHTDDAAFTIGSAGSVTPAGFLADETSPDLVDEGDLGVARMTLNRKPYAVISDKTAERTMEVTADNAAKVDGSAVTQPVSASSLPLPSGAATSAKQDTGLTAVQDQLTQYKITDIEKGATHNYYGFSDKDEGWYILRETVAGTEYRYKKGSGSYATAWTNRASHTYQYFYQEF